MPSHYLNQCWHIPGTKFSEISIKLWQFSLKKLIWNPILSRPHCVNDFLLFVSWVTATMLRSPWFVAFRCRRVVPLMWWHASAGQQCPASSEPTRAGGGARPCLLEWACQRAGPLGARPVPSPAAGLPYTARHPTSTRLIYRLEIMRKTEDQPGSKNVKFWTGKSK